MGTLLRTIRTVLYKVGVSGISFFITWFTVRYLTVDERGTYTVVTFTLLLGTYCISGYGNFFNYGLNRLKLDRQTLVGVASRFVLQILSAIALLLLISLWLAQRYPVFHTISFIVATMAFVTLYGYSSRLLQALNEIDWLNRLNMVQSGLFLLYAAAAWGASKLAPHFTAHYGLALTLWGWMLTNAIAAGVILVIAHRLSGVSFRPLRNDATRKAMLSYGHKIAIQNFLTQANYRGDAYAVQFMLSSYFVGLYGVAVSSSEILWQVSTSISLIVYARIAREERSGSIALTERSIRFTIWFLVIGAAFMLLVFAPLMGNLYTVKFLPAVPAFRILVLGTMAYGTVGVFTQFFTDQLGKVKYPMLLQAMCIVINIAVCLLLIPRFGIIGAALGSTTAYIAALILCIAYYKKQTGRPLRGLFLPTREDRDLLKGLLPHFRRLNEVGK